MTLLLHAITRLAEPRAPDLGLGLGLRGRSLRQVAASGLKAWATELGSQTRDSFTRDDLLDHHRVVAEVFARVDACLPARFPTLIVDADALTEQLEVKRKDLLAELEHVQDCCEVAVTAIWATAHEVSESVEATTPGRRYLLERSAALAASDRRQSRALELADMIERAAGANLVDVRRQVCPSPALALSSALLIRLASAEEVQARLSRRTERDVRILLNGPWPPYTFVGARSDQTDRWRKNSRSSAASSSF